VDDYVLAPPAHRPGLQPSRRPGGSSPFAKHPERSEGHPQPSPRGEPPRFPRGCAAKGRVRGDPSTKGNRRRRTRHDLLADRWLEGRGEMRLHTANCPLIRGCTWPVLRAMQGRGGSICRWPYGGARSCRPHTSPPAAGADTMALRLARGKRILGNCARPRRWLHRESRSPR